MLCIFLFTASVFKREFDFSNASNLCVQVFTDDTTNIYLNKYTKIKNGDGYIVLCSYDEYKQIKSISSKINGVTFIFDGDNDMYNKILLDLKVNIIEKSNTDFIGYSNYFDNCVNYKDKKINIQGYFNGEKIYIGTPLILGS